MNADASGLVNITHDKGIRKDTSPSWAPNGTKAVFMRSTGQGGSSIMVVNSDGSGLQSVTPEGWQSVDPSWSPESSQVVFASNQDGNYELYTTKPHSRLPVQLTRTEAPIQNLDPSWSPDGKSIVFSRPRSHTVGNPNPAQLYLLKVGSMTTTRLTSSPSGLGDRGATWSPDGTSIAFYSDRTGVDNVYILDRSSRQVEMVTSRKVNREPTWAPDGTALTFVSTRSGATELWTLNLVGMTPGQAVAAQLTFDKQGKSHPSWISVPVPLS
jgi:Tol biopolymer transport system component